MMKTKYKSFTFLPHLCQWIDEHPNVHIIGITQSWQQYTIFYKEQDE